MTRFLPRFFIHISAVLLVLAGTAVAIASRSEAEAPPPAKPLAQALRDALTAPVPAGVSGRIEFSNRLVDSAAVADGAGSPLLANAEGRFWIAGDGRARLELQSPAGDAQVQLERDRLTVFEPAANTVYTAALPDGEHAALPGVAAIQGALTRLAGGVALTGPKPGTVAGHPAYTVRLAPRHDGGLLGAAELAWDARHGMPLRAAVYAQGKREPVLELRATDVRFGPVDDGDVAAPRPPGARVVEIDAAEGQGAGKHGGGMGRNAAVSSVQASLPFELSAPATLAGLPRRSVRTLRMDGATGALVTYGKGLGALLVLQEPAGGRGAIRGIPGVQQLSLGGATGHELATALGTVVEFERDGVAYTVLGSVPPAAAEAAARAL